jgi:hypothetical protein
MINEHFYFNKTSKFSADFSKKFTNIKFHLKNPLESTNYASRILIKLPNSWQIFRKKYTNIKFHKKSSRKYPLC